MRKILYNMHFRSQTSPVVDHSEVVRTTGSATGCVVSTMIRPSGVQADIKPSDGDLAFFESELRVTGPDQFQEDGTITIGEDSEHLLRFSTVGQGHLTLGRARNDGGNGELESGWWRGSIRRRARVYQFRLYN